MRNFKDSMKLFRYNWPSIILFEILYKIISTSFMLPICYMILNFSVKAAKLRYLSKHTVDVYLRAPSTYALLFLLMIVVSIFMMINISGLIYAMEASHYGEKTNPLRLLIVGITNALRVFEPRNLGVVLYVLLVLPFSYTIMISGTLLMNKMPDFTNAIIVPNKSKLVIIFAIYIMFCLWSMFRIFSLNYYTIYKMPFGNAIKLSKKAVKSHVIEVILGVVLWNVIFTVLMVLSGGIIAAVAASIIEKVVSVKAARFVLNTMIKVVFTIVYLILSVISTPMIYAHVSACFYSTDSDIVEEKYEKIRSRRHRRSRKAISFANGLSILALVAAAVAADVIFAVNVAQGKASVNIIYPTSASVTAHRGDSANAPENTMAAFILAKDNQADIIELDVRRTSDGRYIIMHDESLARTAGVNVNVSDVTYSYIETLDVGSTFSQMYAGEKIPTLEETIEFAKENDIYLNIELKSIGDYETYVAGILEIIDEYEFNEQCMLASSDYELVKEVKTQAPEMKTVYIMSMAFGDYSTLEYADVFSIRNDFVSKDVVRNIHKRGKEIYAWTVDDEDTIKRLLLYNVDGIITNDPYTTKDIIFNANSSIVVDLLTRLAE